MNIVLPLTHTSATSEVMPYELTVELRTRRSCMQRAFVHVCLDGRNGEFHY
jgi:hypothetical protein